MNVQEKGYAVNACITTEKGVNFPPATLIKKKKPHMIEG